MKWVIMNTVGGARRLVNLGNIETLEARADYVIRLTFCSGVVADFKGDENSFRSNFL